MNAVVMRPCEKKNETSVRTVRTRPQPLRVRTRPQPLRVRTRPQPLRVSPASTSACENPASTSACENPASTSAKLSSVGLGLAARLNIYTEFILQQIFFISRRPFNEKMPARVSYCSILYSRSAVLTVRFGKACG